MKRFLLAVLLNVAFATTHAQAPAPNFTFFNEESEIYIEPGALLYIGNDDNTGATGDLVVKGKTVNPGQEGIYNDGVIAISGNIFYGGTVNSQNFGNPKLNTATAQNYSGYPERLISLIGEQNDQYIKGFLDQPEQSFYNLAIDKYYDGFTSPKVILSTNVMVNGSLIWNPSLNTTPTFDYNNSPVFSNAEYVSPGNGSGLIQTYTGSTDFELYVSNPDPDAIKGFSAIGIEKADVNHIMNSGNSTVNSGLSRAVNNANLSGTKRYVFPIGSTLGGYNPVALDFTQLPATTRKLNSRFADGLLGTVNYNRYATLQCSSQPQWFIYDQFLGNGHWYFEPSDDNNQFAYTLTAYPKTFIPGNGDNNNMRILKNSNNPTGDWTSLVDADYNPAQINSILSSYTTFNSSSDCWASDENGVPGGPYSGFSYFQMGGSSSNALPVELVSLKAFPVNNEFIRVAWTTATEINNERFDVLRSEDGINFVKIGAVAGNGTTTDMHNYTFDDKNVLPNKTYYYRLDQHDFDGTSELSNIVSAAITGSSNVVISEFVPNPTRDASKLFITSPTDVRLDVSMYSAIGQEIQSKSIELAAGVQTPYGVEGHTLAAGNYVVVLRNDNIFVTRRLVITAH